MCTTFTLPPSPCQRHWKKMYVCKREGEKWDDYGDEHDCINRIVGVLLHRYF